MKSASPSVIPRSRIGALFGTQYQNAALRAVPPSWGAFSRRTTSSPSQRANRAAGSPPPPPPTTTMSASMSNGASAAAGAAAARAGTGRSLMRDHSFAEVGLTDGSARDAHPCAAHRLRTEEGCPAGAGGPRGRPPSDSLPSTRRQSRPRQAQYRRRRAVVRIGDEPGTPTIFRQAPTGRTKATIPLPLWLGASRAAGSPTSPSAVVCVRVGPPRGVRSPPTAVMSALSAIAQNRRVGVNDAGRPIRAARTPGGNRLWKAKAPPRRPPRAGERAAGFAVIAGPQCSRPPPTAEPRPTLARRERWGCGRNR